MWKAFCFWWYWNMWVLSVCFLVLLLDASCLIATVLSWNVCLQLCSIFRKSYLICVCYFILFAVTTDKMTNKKPRFGALPTLNMLIRSIESKPCLVLQIFVQNSQETPSFWTYKGTTDIYLSIAIKAFLFWISHYQLENYCRDVHWQ